MGRDQVMKREDLGGVVDGLLHSYARTRLDTRPRPPSRQSIEKIVEQLRRLLFPGYYADENVPASSLRYHVGTWVCELQSDLSRAIRRALVHYDAQPADRASITAQTVSLALLRALPELREALLFDAQALLDGDPAARTIDEIVLTYPGFEAIMVHRLAHWLHRADVPYMPRAISEHAHARTGIDIHPGATIGERFFIDHGTGVVIGESTEIGRDVKIYQGVTLGALSVSRDRAGTKRHPTIEDRVVIYAGATVLGGDTVIGEGAVIGGNVWLTESVAPGTTVIESPPTLHFKSHGPRAAGG